MKAVIMSHEDGGSYCIDSTGSFHFVKGHEDAAIGTEITIQVKKPLRFRKLLVACAAAVIIAVVVVFSCVKPASSNYVQVLGGNNGDAAYAGFCPFDSARYCAANTGCGACPRN